MMTAINEPKGKANHMILVIAGNTNTIIDEELNALDCDFKRVSLYSRPEHWGKLTKDISSATYGAVIINITEIILLISTNNAYTTVFDELLSAISKFPHLVFLYQDSIHGKYNIFSTKYYPQYLYYDRTVNLSKIIKGEVLDWNIKPNEYTVTVFRDSGYDKLRFKSAAKLLNALLYSKHLNEIKTALGVIVDEYKNELLELAEQLDTNDWHTLLRTFRASFSRIAKRVGLEQETIYSTINEMYEFLDSDQVVSVRNALYPGEPCFSVARMQWEIKRREKSRDDYERMQWEIEQREKSRDDDDYSLSGLHDYEASIYHSQPANDIEHGEYNAGRIVDGIDDKRIFSLLNIADLDHLFDDIDELNNAYSEANYDNLPELSVIKTEDIDEFYRLPQSIYNELFESIFEDTKVIKKEVEILELPKHITPYLFSLFYNKFVLEKVETLRNAVCRMNANIEKILDMGMYYSTYKRNKELVPVVRSFVNSYKEDSIFKQYIYKDQLWALEFEKLINMFQEYVRTVRGVNILFDEEKTDIGTVYIFSVDTNEVTPEEFSTLLAEFEEFVNVSEKNTVGAMDLITNDGLSSIQKVAIINQFSKEIKRLKLDIKQTYELRRLELNHRMETALQEATIIENFESIPDDLTGMSHNLVDTVFAQSRNVIINTQTIYGDVYNYEANQELIDLIQTMCKDDHEMMRDLMTDLNILNDKQISLDKRTKSHEKLKQFLTHNLKAIGNVGYKLLTEFLKQLLFP